MEGILTAKIANIIFFFFPIYKRAKYKNGCQKKHMKIIGIEVITDKIGELWVNERHIQK